ncbi:unnamed protein product, partial [Rotaria magnacalcarata]
SVTRLDLSGNQIDENGIQHLAEAIHCNLCLIELNLWSNPIMDEGLQYLANALTNNRVKRSYKFIFVCIDALL